ncbi:hypothetical protein LCGC14_1908230 [marine sediment metagenome]|uniref:Uncharacterized protein n=1 Tax=marine sediment metagenome TaxID=412755 RepID=A0A0F9I8E8_9ZZZZ
MARNLKHARLIAWAQFRQSGIGTPLDKDDLVQDIELNDPLTYALELDEISNRGLVGKGHEFETDRYLNSRHLTGSVPQQALPARFINYIAAACLGNISTGAAAPVYTQTIKWNPVGTTAQGWPISFGIDDDGSDIVLNDVHILNFNISGDGQNRVEMGFDFVGTKTSALATMTWPTIAAENYVHNNSGVFTVATVDKKSQLRSFNLAVNPGVDMDRAWRKLATEAARPFPSAFPFNPETSEVTLTLSLEAEDADLGVWRGYRTSETEVELVISALGAAINGSPFTIGFEIHRGIVTEINHSWEDGILILNPTIIPRYDTSAATPLTITNITADAAPIAAAS